MIIATLISSADDNWMPPWESGGNCTDDFYVEFDDSGSNLLDLISGRWPAQNAQEVSAIVDKTVELCAHAIVRTVEKYGDLCSRRRVERGGIALKIVHTSGLGNLDYRYTSGLFYVPENLRNIVSLQSIRVQHRQKPDGTRDLLETINNGTLLVNYVGHGNERVWTDEQMFVMDRDFPFIDNDRIWPVIVAGTCTWGGYDRPNERCFPELLLAGDGIGAIACIAATRFTFVGQNQRLTREFYTEIFRQGIDSRQSLSEALLQTKLLGGDNRLYHTLGNPVLRLATPEYYAYVDERDDSLQAGGLFHLSGFVSRTNNSANVYQGSAVATLTKRSGQIFRVSLRRVFLIRRFRSLLFPRHSDCSTPSQTPYYYGLPGNAIFRGRSSIENGRFDVTFRVPRDIQYGGDNAKVSLYFFGKSDSESDSADGIGIEYRAPITHCQRRRAQ